MECKIGIMQFRILRKNKGECALWQAKVLKWQVKINSIFISIFIKIMTELVC